ncbi:MAG: beta-glucuronidase [Butyrivibrio sp.]|nr:beta-glucuronidase [Acetatifactor muris]MCM1558930.1 beta-glucuronidase [Butyrivibrio sp.]
MNIKMNLQGIWQFRLDREKQGLNAHYETLDFDDTILLPTTVSEAGKGTPHRRTDTGHLTDPYEMEGYSWYRKTLSLPLKDTLQLAGKHFELTLERTRLSHVWVDGVYAGSFDSFVAKHRYDLTGLIKTLNPSITIMVSNTDYKVPGGHLTSPDTQTNWNGILGEIALTVREDIRLGAVEAGCRYEENGILLKIPVQYDGLLPCPAGIQVQPVLCRLKDVYAEPDKIIPESGNYEDFVEWTPLPREKASLAGTLQPGENHFELFLDLSDEPRLWDEEAPYVYRLHLSCKACGDTGKLSSEASLPSASADMTSVWCGLRSFTADRTHFYMNGRKTFLRGRQDGMIFPKTGYAPMDVAGWLHVMKIARDYGINHYRFHTCCPPEAAFIAADLLGIYMQPEIPFWGTFNGPDDEGYNKEAQDFLEAEGFRMLEAFSNHPSYCMMSMGNELWGNASALNDLLAKYKAFRPDILFTQGSNNFFWTPNIQPHDDFFSGVRFTVDRQIRGSYAMCDKPLGHVQTAVPGTRFNYDRAIRPSYMAEHSCQANPSCTADPSCQASSTCLGFPSEEFQEPADASAETAASNKKTVDIQYGTGVKKVSLSEVCSELIPEVPVISHEIGQYEMYPDFREIETYTGVLKARNLEEFRRRLAEKGMLDLADDFFRSSGALAVACYKDELETALRSSQLAGFQLLDIQDFTGQGTALIGILNAFMENKGLITAAEWRRFCSDAVLQAEFDSYVVISDRPFEFAVSLSYFKKMPLPNDKLVCCLKDSDGNVISCVSTPVTALTGVFTLGEFSIRLPKADKPASLTLSVELENLGVSNSYQLWMYDNTSAGSKNADPEALPDKMLRAFPSVPAVSDFPIAQRLAQLPVLAEKFNACLLFLSDAENRASIEGTYCTDFWCYSMFRNISLSANKETPVGTLGLLIRKEHEALSGFPCEAYTTPQWHSIINASRSTILDGTELVPIVQTIDNFSRNHRLGMIYELYLQDLDLGLLVCTGDLPRLIQEGYPEAEALCESLVSYLPKLAEKRRNPNAVYAMTGEEFRQLLSRQDSGPEYDL